MMRQRLRAILLSPDKRLLRAEARFFDAYCRGGCRDPRDLVIPLDFFARPRVKAALDAWLLGERPLDVDRLCAEWRAGLGAGAHRDERLFFKNLADFASILGNRFPATAASPPVGRAPWRWGRRHESPQGPLLK